MNKKTARIAKLTLAGLAIGLVCFALLITHVLTSGFDGLWYADAAYQSGAWEISLGRFMIPVIDFFRFALNVEPLQSVLTLAMLAFGSVLLLELFSFTESKFALPVVVLLCTCPTVCIFLSYRYTAPAYGVSYVLAIAAVWVLGKAKGTERRKEIALTATGALLLVLCLGTYQAHFGCACVAIVFYAVYLCMQENTTVKDVLRFLVRSVVAGLVACVVYKVIWDITVKAVNAEVPDYRGAQGLSVFGIIGGLPYGVKQSYKFFLEQFLGAENRFSLFQGSSPRAGAVFSILQLILFGVVASLVFYCIRKRGKKGVLVAALFITLPMACGVFCLLSNETGFVSMQMTMPYMMVAPLIIVLMDLSINMPDPLVLIRNQPFSSGKADKVWIAVICGVLLYGRICQTQVDQFVMYEGTKTTERMVQDAVAQAAHDGLLEEDVKLMFIGVPADNGLFRKSELFDRANPYARFGQFWYGPYPYWRCYGGLLRRMGVNREVPDLQTYVDLMEETDVRRMPVYPEDGCMLLKDDVLIVKFANEKDGD